jgi:hypothetical protein
LSEKTQQPASGCDKKLESAIGLEKIKGKDQNPARERKA